MYLMVCISRVYRAINLSKYTLLMIMNQLQLYEIDFVCNPEKGDQIITDVEKGKAKLLGDAELCRIED